MKLVGRGAPLSDTFVYYDRVCNPVVGCAAVRLPKYLKKTESEFECRCAIAQSTFHTVPKSKSNMSQGHHPQLE